MIAIDERQEVAIDAALAGMKALANALSCSHAVSWLLVGILGMTADLRRSARGLQADIERCAGSLEAIDPEDAASKRLLDQQQAIQAALARSGDAGDDCASCGFGPGATVVAGA
jgi:hypothetical protein